MAQSLKSFESSPVLCDRKKVFSELLPWSPSILFHYVLANKVSHVLFNHTSKQPANPSILRVIRLPPSNAPTATAWHPAKTTVLAQTTMTVDRRILGRIRLEDVLVQTTMLEDVSHATRCCSLHTSTSTQDLSVVHAPILPHSNLSWQTSNKTSTKLRIMVI